MNKSQCTWDVEMGRLLPSTPYQDVDPPEHRSANSEEHQDYDQEPDSISPAPAGDLDGEGGRQFGSFLLFLHWWLAQASATSQTVSSAITAIGRRREKKTKESTVSRLRSS